MLARGGHVIKETNSTVVVGSNSGFKVKGSTGLSQKLNGF